MRQISHSRRNYLICLALTTLTLMTYRPVTNHSFINYDDDPYIIHNSHVKTGVTFENIIWAFTTGREGNWHPLTWLSHMVDCQFFGLDSGSHHLINLILHAINAFLLFLVLQRMTKASWQSAFVAAVFAIHPLNVESVAWAAERKNVLSTFFWMLTMWTYLDYVEHKRRVRHALTLFFFTLGLMSKPMLVTLPFVFLLFDWWPLKRFNFSKTRTASKKNQQQESSAFTALLKEKIPFFLLALVSSLITFVVQRHEGAVANLEMVPINLRSTNIINSYATYIGKLLYPMDLAIPYLPYELPTIRIVGATLILLGISIISVRIRKNRPYILVGWCWYLGTLVPVIGFIQVGEQALADRYMYIPMIGLLMIIAWGIKDFISKWRYQKMILGCLTVAIFLFLIVRTSIQLSYWKNSISLFEHTAEVTANNYTAHYHLALKLADQGKLEEAVTQYHKALQLYPENFGIHNNLGNTFIRQNKFEEANAEYFEAWRLKPDDAETLKNIGNTFNRQGKFEEAIRYYLDSIQKDPKSIEALNNLAWIRSTNPNPKFRDGNEAIRLAKEACKLTNYKQPAFLDTLAAAYAEANQFSEAIKMDLKALELSLGTNEKQLIKDIQSHLERYKINQPFHEN